MEIKELKEKLLNEKKHDFNSLVELVSVLRSPEGCQWDRKQDHQSIRSDIIEETYEVVEAIDKNDKDLLKEELGDVLFQVMFHSQLSKEYGEFDIDDVIDGIVTKMIYRHPHVFGNVKVSGSSQILENWDVLKGKEKSRNTVEDVLKSVPKQYPALMRAKKIVKKAEKYGVVITTREDAIREITEKAAMLSEAEGKEKEALISRIIFLSVLISDKEADVEKDLGKETEKFIDDVIKKGKNET